MTPYWFGQEDHHFPIGPGTINVNTSAARSGYSRYGIANSNATVANYRQTNPFEGGAQTSAWFSCRYWSQTSGLSKLPIGLGLSGTAKGLFIGSETSTATKWALSKYDGTTRTQLASESGSTLAIATLYRVDMQVVSYGASAVVNVFIDGVLKVTYTGDVTVSGMSSFDCITLLGQGSSAIHSASEIFVVDQDPRPTAVVLAQGAPTGGGTTTDWGNNAASNVNANAANDANPAFSNTANQVQEWDVTNGPSGTFQVIAAKVAARAAMSPNSSLTKLKLGYNDGGTVSLGADITLTVPYATYERMDTLNPNGSVAWDQSIIDALQVAAKSIT